MFVILSYVKFLVNITDSKYSAICFDAIIISASYSLNLYSLINLDFFIFGNSGNSSFIFVIKVRFRSVFIFI